VFAPILKGDDLLLGPQVPVGAAGTPIAAYIRKNDKTAPDQDATQYAVGNNSDAGTGDRATTIGVRHSF
jgi:GBP family porin